MNSAAASASLAGDGAAVLFLIAFAVFAVWCVPLIIAMLYDLPRKGAIAVLSLGLGWTGVAWLAALVIAVASAIRLSAPASSPPGPAALPRRRPPRGAHTGPYPG